MAYTSKPDPLRAILERLNGTVIKVTKLRQSLGDLENELSEICQLCEDEICTRTVAKSSFRAVTDYLVPMERILPSGPVSTSTSPIPVSQGLGSSIPVSKSLTTAVYHPPRLPTDPFPFPENIDLSSYPSELKREGHGWFVLSNPSPKVKRVLDVHLVRDLVHDQVVQCLRFSRDGKWLAAGIWRTAHIYDVERGVETCVFDHGDVYVLSVCFSSDEKYLATVTATEIWIWDITKKQIHKRFEGNQNLIRSSPNGQFIVSGSADGSVDIWDVDGRPVKVLTINDHYSLLKPQRVFSVAISPDGRYMAVGGQDSVVNILNVTTDVLVQKLRGHRRGVPSVAFTPDGKGLISGSLDGTLRYWDISRLDIGSGVSAALTCTSVISSSPCLLNLTGHKYGVSSIAVSHDGTWVVSTSNDGKVLFWDLRTGVAQCMVSGHVGSVNRVDLSPTGNLLATASSWDQRVRIWSYDASS